VCFGVLPYVAVCVLVFLCVLGCFQEFSHVSVFARVFLYVYVYFHVFPFVCVSFRVFPCASACSLCVRWCPCGSVWLCVFLCIFLGLLVFPCVMV